MIARAALVGFQVCPLAGEASIHTKRVSISRRPRHGSALRQSKCQAASSDVLTEELVVSQLEDSPVEAVPAREVEGDSQAHAPSTAAARAAAAPPAAGGGSPADQDDSLLFTFGESASSGLQPSAFQMAVGRLLTSLPPESTSQLHQQLRRMPGGSSPAGATLPLAAAAAGGANANVEAAADGTLCFHFDDDDSSGACASTGLQLSAAESAMGRLFMELPPEAAADVQRRLQRKH